MVDDPAFNAKGMRKLLNLITSFVGTIHHQLSGGCRGCAMEGGERTETSSGLKTTVCGQYSMHSLLSML